MYLNNIFKFYEVEKYFSFHCTLSSSNGLDSSTTPIIAPSKILQNQISKASYIIHSPHNMSSERKLRKGRSKGKDGPCKVVDVR